MTAPPSPPRSPSARLRTDVIAAACTMAGVLASFGSAYGLHQVTDISAQQVVLAAVLALTLSRMFTRAHHHPMLIVVEIPVVGLAASGAGWLVVNLGWLGQPLLLLAMCIGLVTRRWGGIVRQAGRLVALPFLAILITPAPAVPGGRSSTLASILWSPVIGLIALACAGMAVAVRSRLLPGSAPAAGPEPAPRRPRRGLDAGSRMAVQMAVGLVAGLVAGHLLFAQRWSWTVLSAYIVASGNRGRGDVVHKAALRVLGAGIGTVGVSLATVDLAAGNRWLIVALFAVMAVALVLRERSYAFWACGVTAMVALLHGYYGDTGVSALQERAIGVIVGSAIAVAAAWFVLPIRTTDVLRRRVVDCLAALSDDLDPERTELPAVPAALRAVDEIAPAWRAHQRTLGRRHDLHPMQVVGALHRLGAFPLDARDRLLLRRDIVRVRRSLVGKDDPEPADLPADVAIVHAFLHRSR